MKIFRRTLSGLANLRLFKNADLVVFTEGGAVNYNYSDVLMGRYNETSGDIKFWKPLFDVFRPTCRVSFCAVGAKATLKEIASDIKKGNLTGVCVVMDKDHDDVFGGRIRHSNVIYTHGYSWESSLFHPQIIIKSYYEVLNINALVPGLEKLVRGLIKSIQNDLRGVVRADVLLCFGGSSLFTRSNNGNAITNSIKNRPPSVRRAWLKDEIKRKRQNIGRLRPLTSPRKLDAVKHCFGKLLLCAAREILQYLFLQNGYPKLPNKYANIFLLRQFSMWVSENTNSAISKYYGLRIAKITR